jgi:hypothetical protein
LALLQDSSTIWWQESWTDPAGIKLVILRPSQKPDYFLTSLAGSVSLQAGKSRVPIFTTSHRFAVEEESLLPMAATVSL